MAHDDAPDTVTLRVARVVYLMTMGQWLVIDDVAHLTGLTESGAQKLMERLAASESVPVMSVAGPRGKLKWGLGPADAQDWPW